LSKADEFLKLVHEGSSKASNPLITFYNDLKTNLKSLGSNFSSEELLTYYHALIDDKKVDFFFESIVFTELNKTGFFFKNCL